MGWIERIGPGELMAICSAVTFAAGQVAARQGMRSSTPMTAALFLNGIVSLGAYTIAIWSGELQRATLIPILWYMAIGVAGPGMGRITSLLGITRMGLNPSVTITSSTPIWSTLFAVLFLAEAPTWAVLAGTLGIVGGIILLSLRKSKEASSFGSWFRGALVFPLVASFAYALPPIFAKMAFVHQKTPVVGIAIAFTVGNLVLLAAKPLLPNRGRIHADKRAMLWFSLGGVVGLATSLLLWTAISIAPVSTTLPLSRTGPFWVLLLSYLYLRKAEPITRRLLFASAMVVIGGILITIFRG